MFGRGVSKLGELLDLGIAAGLVEKSGAWLSYKGERLGQGRENARQFLAQNQQAAQRLEQEIRAHARALEEAMLGDLASTGAKEDEAPVGAADTPIAVAEAPAEAGGADTANTADTGTGTDTGTKNGAAKSAPKAKG